MNAYLTENETTGIYTGVASLITSLVAGGACIGPMLGIALGVGGLGWLSRYSYLTAPAAMASLLLIGVAVYLYKKRRTSCADRRKHMLNRVFLIVTALIVLAINVTEFLILPNMS